MPNPRESALYNQAPETTPPADTRKTESRESTEEIMDGLKESRQFLIQKRSKNAAEAAGQWGFLRGSPSTKTSFLISKLRQLPEF